MRVFNLNRTFKFCLETLWSGPYTESSEGELFVFLFDGTEGIPAQAEDVFPSGSLDNMETFSRNCFAYGILDGLSPLIDNTDTGYRAGTRYLTLKHPVLKPAIPSGFLNFAGASVAVPEHLAFTPDWINGTGTGTSLNNPAYRGMNKMVALSPAYSKFANPRIGVGFTQSRTLAQFASFEYFFNEPITTDCFLLQRGRTSFASSGTMARFSVQYLNESDVWVTLGTTPAVPTILNASTFANHYLQFSPVTASRFRLLRTVAHTGSSSDIYSHGYFGNTNVSAPVPFVYPETVYGLIVPNTVYLGKINSSASTGGGNGNGDVTEAGALPRSRAVCSAASTDYQNTPSGAVNSPCILCDCSDLAGSGRIKLPELSSDALNYFGFTNLVVDLL
jgi:hypothetical protein